MHHVGGFLPVTLCPSSPLIPYIKYKACPFWTDPHLSEDVFYGRPHMQYTLDNKRVAFIIVTILYDRSLLIYAINISTFC